MRRLFLAIFVLLTALRLPAAVTPAAPLTPDCRYLFVIDTSLSMTRLQESISTSVSQMIATGLDGQMKPGEVFTIWTFNEDVQQHEFPLTSWSPERSQAMGRRVGEFLRSRRFRRNSNMRTLINAIYQAKRICPRLAVFLITNGEEVLVGTPFDRNINVSYGRRFEELRSARVPFITTLLCQNSEFVSWATQAANEPFDLPAGPDGKPVVGRQRQPLTSKPAPVPPDARTPPVLGPVANTLKLQDPPPARKQPTKPPVEPVAPPKAKPEPTKRAPAKPPKREVVELTPTPDPDAPRVVKPTDVSPAPKRKLPKLPFTKESTAKTTNAPPPAPKLKPKPQPEPKPKSKPVKPAPQPEPVADPPVAIDEVKTNTVTPLATAPTTNAPAVKPPAQKTVKVVTTNQPPKPKPAAPKPTPTPKPATTNREPDVVLTATPKKSTLIQTTNTVAPVTKVVIITQVVNVAWPQKPKPKPKPAVVVEAKPAIDKPADAKPEPQPEAKQPEPKPTPAEPVEAQPAPKPATKPVPSFVAKSSTNFTAVPSAPSPPPPSSEIAAAPPSGRPLIQWIYLGAAVVLLVIAGMIGRKLMSPPIDASLISQSMDDHDQN